MQIDFKWTQSGNEADAGTGSVAEGQSASTLSPLPQPRTESSVRLCSLDGDRAGFKVHITYFIRHNGIPMSFF